MGQTNAALGSLALSAGRGGGRIILLLDPMTGWKLRAGKAGRISPLFYRSDAYYSEADRRATWIRHWYAAAFRAL